MSLRTAKDSASASVSRRPLRADFTTSVLRSAVRARRRHTRRQILLTFMEPLRMKKIKFIRTVPGAIASLGIVAIGGISAYALTNWFGGEVAVTQHDSSILSVDLSSCKSPLPPGITTNDRHNVQFKITGTPHVVASTLQQSLLAQCEANAVVSFYAPIFPQAHFGVQGIQAHPSHYVLPAAKVSAITGDTITLDYPIGKGAYGKTRQFSLSRGTTYYNQGKSASLGDIRVGDFIMFVAYSGSVTPDETTSVLDASDVQLLSIFKTQYDTGSTLHYDTFNVKPL